MDKNVAMGTGAGSDLFRDQANAVFLQVFDSHRQIGNSQANVVQSLAALGDEFCDHRVLARGFQQFQASFPDGDHDHTNFLRWDKLFRRSPQTELLVNRPRRRERFHRNTEMVESKLHVRPKLFLPVIPTEAAMRSAADHSVLKGQARMQSLSTGKVKRCRSQLLSQSPLRFAAIYSI